MLLLYRGLVIRFVTSFIDMRSTCASSRNLLGIHVFVAGYFLSIFLCRRGRPRATLLSSSSIALKHTLHVFDYYLTEVRMETLLA